jgi:hypothetical protein
MFFVAGRSHLTFRLVAMTIKSFVVVMAMMYVMMCSGLRRRSDDKDCKGKRNDRESLPHHVPL